MRSLFRLGRSFVATCVFFKVVINADAVAEDNQH